jgi:hypothetical protein
MKTQGTLTRASAVITLMMVGIAALIWSGTANAQPPALSGTWLNKADAGEPCSIQMQGERPAMGGGVTVELTLVNEQGTPSRGVLRLAPATPRSGGRRTLTAYDWNDSRGMLLPGNQVILWKGAGFWARRPGASARWSHNGPCRMIFDRGRVWAVNENGDRSWVDLTDDFGFYARDWNDSGHFAANGDIVWQSGDRWTR